MYILSYLSFQSTPYFLVHFSPFLLLLPNFVCLRPYLFRHFNPVSQTMICNNHVSLSLLLCISVCPCLRYHKFPALSLCFPRVILILPTCCVYCYISIIYNIGRKSGQASCSKPRPRQPPPASHSLN